MDTFQLTIELIKDPIERDGISFSQCNFLTIEINGVAHDMIAEFKDGAVYWEELRKSAKESGKYLIFTCFCGIPDDAGFDYIRVEHEGKNVIWSSNRSSQTTFVFSKQRYLNQILGCEEKLEKGIFPVAITSSEYPEC